MGTLLRVGLIGLGFVMLAPGAAAQPLDPCSGTEACREHGECTSNGDDCVAASSLDCAGSEGCRVEGLCTAAAGECVAFGSEDCAQSSRCHEEGICSFDPEDNHCDKGTKPANAPLMTGGIVVSALGGAGFIAGVVLAGLQTTYCGIMGPPEGRSCIPVLGLGVMGAGLALGVGVGVPMAVIGGRKEARGSEIAAPLVIVDPGGVTLRWAF